MGKNKTQIYRHSRAEDPAAREYAIFHCLVVLMRQYCPLH